jgi:DNA polymerase-3 subunit alpha
MLWNIHTYYSLRYGTLSVEELVLQAKQLGLQTIGITDINCSTGIFEFVKCCEQHGIKPIAGIEFREGNHLLFTAVAKNTAGIQEINRLLSDYNLYGRAYADRLKHLQNSFVIYPIYNYPGILADHELIGIRLSEFNKLLRKDVSKIKNKLILQQPVTFRNAASYPLHMHLRAIDNNVLLSRLEPNAVAAPDEYFMSEPDIIHACRYHHYVLNNTIAFMDRCSVSFDFKTHKNKKVYSSSVYDDKQLLQTLAYDGLTYRYGSNNTVAKQRVQKELDIIDKLGFSAYFLITWDIIRYSMSKGFYHVGRGSGANSVVAYCLRITDVDPIELNLYFERFLNPKRTSPPDFDIDYSWKERPQVHDYIFKRYGRDHTALLGTMSTFRSSSIYRELGKVYGLPKSEIDILADYPHKADRKSPVIAKILNIGTQLQDFPNHRSIHAGGVLISEEPIFQYSALDLPPVGLPTVQWDMYMSEDIGFEKFDILSQRGIGHIKDAAELVWQNKQIKVDVHEVQKFKNDPLIKQQLKEANSIGCFYIESPGMRGLLKKLKCDTYIHLVAASSIIRPGVAKSGMMRAYIQRFHDPKSINYLHPVMQEQLEETYGVMVFQEDVLKVCHHFAGLDLADADVLRRAMSGKFRSKAEFQKIIDKFFANCKEKGYPDELSKEVWRQIESFAGYSFSKAHSASFAVESFQSLFLKTYYPMEFMVGVINNFGGFYRTWVYVTELKKTGAKVHLPCVNESDQFTNIKGEDVYLGFTHIESLELKSIEAILVERSTNGPFQSFIDFIDRVPISVLQIKILIKVGAFKFCGMGKKNLMWQAYSLQPVQPIRQAQGDVRRRRIDSNDESSSAFTLNRDVSLSLPKGIQNLVQETMLELLPAKSHKEFTLPALVHNEIEDAYDEIELLGFPLSMSEFDLLQTDYRGDVVAVDMSKYLGQTVRMLGNYVTAKNVKTVRGDYMAFGTFYDVQSNFFDTTHFAQSLAKYPFEGRGVYLIEGKVVQEFGFYSVEVNKLAKLPTWPDPRY